MKSKLRAVGALYLGGLIGLSTFLLSVLFALLASSSDLKINVDLDQHFGLKLIASTTVVSAGAIASIRVVQSKK